MKLKKLLALTLTGAVLTASLTACTPLDAAELVYDSIFGGGSSSTGSTGSGNNGSTGGNTGSGSTAEEAENREVAAAYVKSLQSDSYTGKNYANITPVYDIPNLEEFVREIDEYCTKECETNGKSWEYTVHNLSKEKLNDLAKVLHKENYENAEASLQFGKDIQGTPETNCQGLFNQIHRKLTKGARSTVWLLTPHLTDYIFPFSRSLQRYA